MHLLVIKPSQKSSFWPNEKFGWYPCNAPHCRRPHGVGVDEDACISVVDAIEEVQTESLEAFQLKTGLDLHRDVCHLPT